MKWMGNCFTYIQYQKIGARMEMIKVRKIKFTISIGLVGCRREDTFEFDDDTTDEEIQQAYTDWMYEQIDGGWEEVEE